MISRGKGAGSNYEERKSANEEETYRAGYKKAPGFEFDDDEYSEGKWWLG